MSSYLEIYKATKMKGVAYYVQYNCIGSFESDRVGLLRLKEACHWQDHPESVHVCPVHVSELHNGRFENLIKKRALQNLD